MPSNSILAQMAVQISAQTAQFNSALAQSQRQLNLFQRSVQTAGNFIQGYFGVTTIFRGLEAGVEILAQFEFKMSEVAAITGATGEELKKLETNARDLGKSTLFTATQVAALEVELGRLGFTTPEILSASRATVLLATATGEDLSKAAVAVGTSIRQFLLPATEAGHLADVMAGAFNKTGLALDDFAVAMSYAGPQAAAAGISFEETSALLGVLANSGIKASTAGTSLRRIIADLAKDSRPLTEKLAELASKGITVQGALDEVGRIAATSLIILEKGADQIAPLTKELRDGVGAAAETAAIRMDTLVGDTERLKGAFNNLILEGQPLTVVLRFLEQGLTNSLNALTDERLSRFARFTALVQLLSGDTGGLQVLGAIEKGLTEQEKQLNETAKETFLTYAKGYADTSSAAKAYQALQFQVINLASLKLKSIQETYGVETESGKAAQVEFDAEVAGRQRILKIIQEYIRALPEVADASGQAAARTIGDIERQISAQKELKANLVAGDASAYGQWVKRLQELETELAKAETGYINLDRAANHAANSMRVGIKAALGTFTDETFTPPSAGKINTSALAGIGSAESINHLQDTQEELRKTREEADKAAEGFNRVRLSVQSGSEALVEFSISAQKVIVSYKKLTQVAIIDFAKALGEVFAGGIPSGDNLLRALASFAVQFGELLVATALAAIAFKESLKLNPYVALAAGIALIAAGSAASAALNKSSQGVGGAVGGSASSRGSSFSGLSANTLQIEGQVILKGQDAWIMLNNYNNNKNG